MTETKFIEFVITLITVWILGIFGIITFLDKGSWKTYLYGLVIITVISFVIISVLGCADYTENRYMEGDCYRVHTKVNPLWVNYEWKIIPCEEMGLKRIR